MKKQESMLKAKKRPKKRTLFLVSAYVAIIAATLIYIISVGSVYEEKILLWNDNPRAEDFKIEIADESVLSLDSVEIVDDGTEKNAKLMFKAKSLGKTDVEIINTKDNEDDAGTISILFAVLPGNVVFNTYEYNFNGIHILMPSFGAIMFLTIIVLCYSFIKKIKNHDFSYSMVSMGGGLIYCLSLIISFIIFNIFVTEKMEITSLYEIMAISMTNGLELSSALFPFLLLFSAAIGISNIWLVIKEGFRPVNLLGFVLGAALSAGFAAMMLLWLSDYEGSTTDYLLSMLLTIAVSYTFCYFCEMLISTVVCSVIAVKHKVPYNIDYIIILGCAIRKDGTPTPILKGRIDRAIEFEKKQYESTGRHAYFVPSGGQGSDEVISEAECIKRYLIEQGISRERILSEDKSVNTYQNMEFSKRVIEEHCEDIDNAGVVFSTTNYHVFRGYTIAKKVNMKVHGLSAKTKLYFFPNAFVREFIGLLVAEKRRHIIYLLTVISVNLAMGVLLMI